MTWTCRLDGKPGRPSTLPIGGLWVRTGGGTDEFLMPDPGGEATEADGARFAVEGQPDAEEVDAVIALGSTLPDEASWLDLIDRDPLAALEQSKLDEHPLESAILAHLPSVQEVFRRPRTHIEHRTALVPVGRARRLDRRADVRLASHTEDWEHLTLRGVQPRRVLAQVRDEQWDLYENRLAVRLVDHLLRWLAGRILSLERWLGVFQDLQRIQEQAGIEGSWRRRDRVFRLWADAGLQDNRRRAAEERLRRLHRLRRRLDELRDTVLYRAIPQRARVPDLLRPSNALQHDTHYRRVAALWREWASHRRHDDADPDRLRQRQQSFAWCFQRFCRLLVVRALDQLGMEPEALEAPVGRSEIVIDGAVVRLGGSGGLEVWTGGALAIRLLPIATCLAARRDHETARSRLGRAASDDRTVVLHLGLGRQIENETPGLARLAHEDEAGRVGVLPVSPWDIASTERVARAIRWALLTPVYRNWPARVVAVGSVDTRGGWARSAGNALVVQRAPEPGEFDLAGLRSDVSELRRQKQSLEQQRESVRLEGARNRDDRRRRKDVNERKKRLNEAVKEAEADLEARESFLKGLEEALEVVQRVAVCPPCAALGEEQPGRLQARHRETFLARCESCETEWGTVPCGCGAKVPFLRTPGAIKTFSAGTPVDRALGQDVLAVPARDGMGSVRCDQCGGEAEL